MERKYLPMKFSNLEKVNDEFVKCTISVNSYDQIANGTKFRKEAIEKALPTLNYCPVIGYFKEGDFSGHGIEYKITEEGFEEVVKTIPFGVIIKDSYRWEKMMKDNGEYEDYIVADAYLWGRYKEAVDVVKENLCNQSMEVNVHGVDSSTWDYYDITEFSYSACCILSKDVQPAFNLSKIRTSDKFSKDDFKACYSEMTEALDRFLSFEEGGNTMEENKEFETEIEETTEEFAKKKRKCSLCEQEFEVAEDFSDEEEFTCDACKESEEYAKKKKKCEADEEETKEDFEAKYNEVVVELEDLKVKYTDLQTELATSKEEYTTLETEAKELREYKSNIEFEAHKVAVDEELAKYSELESVDGYADLIKGKYEVDINELIKDIKIFAFDNGIVLGKKAKKNFSKEVTNKIPVVNQTKEIPNAGAWDILDKYIKR